MQQIDQLYPLLSQPKKVVITMHQKPDGDAMGSTLGLYHFLKQFGHTVTVISPTNWPAFINWMPEIKLVLDYERQTQKSDVLIEEADWIFCLDFNRLSRTKLMENKLGQSKGQRILIDHHEEPDLDKFAYGISNPDKSSTCEMVYDFIVNSGHSDKINAEVAESLYTGVMTDTGSFRFPSTSASVHRMVATLKEKGLKHSRIHEELFDNNSENRYRFLGNILSNRLEVFYEYNTALITIPQSDLIKYNVKTGDTEGLVNYPLGIQGIKMAAIIIDRGEERKSSFRSNGAVDVNNFASKYFNGGGHYNAAGANNKESLEEVRAKFIEAMKENKDQLSNYKF
ncbi:MAG: bifunctional oligoribonuclease/PAP phosphatase NrnA [Sphingobacteriales bacterium]|nr:bifunctional oligoribonuclease/PAP phosphatase NrnA [Sphingobacteriales bacterium]